MDLAVIVLLAILVVLVFIILLRSVRIIPQARAGIVERLGKYQSTLTPGLHFLIPFVDRLLPLIDLREQVQSFPAQSVITEDNLVVGIDGSSTSRSWIRVPPPTRSSTTSRPPTS